MTKFHYSHNTTTRQKGFGLISLIILLAFVFAALNVYSYYNPGFSLAKYSPLNYVRAQRDAIRVKDLDKLRNAIVAYYAAKNEVPVSSCGRISGVMHPEFANAITPFLDKGDLLADPTTGGTEKDYFYMRVDRTHFILMAVLEMPTTDTTGKYNYTSCHDWPGDNVYNYQVNNLE